MPPARHALRREIPLSGAVGVGLGSIVGTGAFVTLGLGAALAGPWLLLSIAIAGALAMCNGLGSAQLAAVHPVSGGTYAYGIRFLHPIAGFTAGWVFLVAKTASAATAALAFGGLVAWVGGKPGDHTTMVLGGLGSLLLVGAAALAGIQRSTRFNLTLVVITLFALASMVAIAAPEALRGWHGLSWARVGERAIGAPAVLHAAALAFVAFAGFARIATLGEEVHEPRTTIPRAIGLTIAAAVVLYALVAFTGLGVLGPAGYGRHATADGAPLLAVAHAVGAPALALVLGVGAASALLAVQLNLVMGLARVALAAGREGDLPAALARVGPGGVPIVATVSVLLTIGLIVALGRVPGAWSLSAAAVLVYYAITNLAAMRVAEGRFIARWVHALGLAGCCSLAVFIDVRTLLLTAALIGIGLAARWAVRRRPATKPGPDGAVAPPRP